MFQRFLNRVGRYIDELLFGPEDRREIEWAIGIFLVGTFLYIAWEIARHY